ncbi:hypothetical protein MPER_16338, partial [Moniliophthora perniciosa FA553]
QHGWADEEADHECDDLVLARVLGISAASTSRYSTWLLADDTLGTGPFFYRAQDAPEYRLGIGSMLVSNCIELGIFFVLRMYFQRANRIRDAQTKDSSLDDPPNQPTENETAFSDLTDLQNV